MFFNEDCNQFSADREISSLYPWEKLDSLGHDGCWIDANNHTHPEILRHPSIDRHPSFGELPGLRTNTFEKSHSSLTSTTKFAKVAGSTSSTTQLQFEIDVQDAYIKEKYGLHRFRIIPDGNCMYRALAQALAHDQDQYKTLRKEIVNFIKDNRKQFEEIIEGSFEVFIEEAAKENTWGSYVELLAVTKLLSINIVIVTGGFPSNPEVSVTCHHFDPDNDEITPKDTVWLSWLSNGHYDVIVRGLVENKRYDAWLSQKTRQIENDAALAKRLSKEEEEYDQSWKVSGSCSGTVGENTVASSNQSSQQNRTRDRVWTMEEDEELAQTLQEAENVFASYSIA